MIRRLFAKRAWLVALAAVFLIPGPGRAEDMPGGQQTPFELAVLQAANDVSLDDIISGRARRGFNPVVADGLHLIGTPGQTIWLRLRADLGPPGGARFVSLPRQAIETLRLQQAGLDASAGKVTGNALPAEHARWPEWLVLPLPADTQGPTTLYLQVQGHGHLNLQPRLISEAQLQAQAAASSERYGLLYGSLLLIFLLGLMSRWLAGERSLRVAVAALACLAASLVSNQHLQLSLGGTSVAAIPALPAALWIIACGTLLWATLQYAGHEKNVPPMAAGLQYLGFVLVIGGALTLLLPQKFLPQLQVAALAVLLLTALICAASLLFDPRQWRWAPMLIWLAMLPALLVIPLALLQILPATGIVRHGFQCLLALQLALYLFLPWIRRALQERAKGKRAEVVEASAEEKIAHAREWMLSSLQAGIENAGDGDMEWIAYRRLMVGLQPVLPQTAAAVIAMNYHNEDLMLVEPKSADARFQSLLAQRGSLLKNLSRSLAPQQIGIDFDGPEGPLEHVMLAIIPLPIDRPGWGALVIERNANTSYSDEELDLCTEFAQLATTAADEAAAVMHLRQATQIDAESSVFKREMIEQMLARAHETAIQKSKPLSLLRVSLDGFEGLEPGAAPALVHRLADMIRDEIDFGESIGRFAADEFVVLLPGRAIGEARTLGERICTAVRKQALVTNRGMTLSISLGVAQMQPNERSPQLMLDRAAKGLLKARQYGGNQVQAVTSTTF